jgi:hypothetical protein
VKLFRSGSSPFFWRTRTPSSSCYESWLAVRDGLPPLVIAGACYAWSCARNSTAGVAYKRSSLPLYLWLIEDLQNIATIEDNGFVDGIVATAQKRIPSVLNQVKAKLS